MSRNPGCGARCPTKTQQLRQAKTSAMVKELERKEEALARHQADPFGRRKRVVMPEPKKVDFKKPTMTKAMMARVKHAEKFKQEYERKQEALLAERRPKRTAAPIGGDARLGKERARSKERRRPRTPAASPTRLSPREAVAGPSHAITPKRLPRTPEQVIPKKTNELARMMNADVIQAEPIGDGPISNVVIPPGVVNDNRTTIISIPQPDAEASVAASQAANRSIQVISETLDEQDAAEAAAVQNRLTDLQQARRDFVITVANVGGNVVNIEDMTPPPDWSPRVLSSPSPPSTRRQLYKVPDLEDEFLQVEYGRDHPHLRAAREHMQKVLAEKEAREAARRMEEEFQRIAATEQLEDLHLDVPFEEELYQDKDISWEEDETGMAMPRPSRVKAYTEDVPIAERSYAYEPFDPEELEKFFDLQRYPPSPYCAPCGPPAGRETLHPDLWELEDPWFRPPPDDRDLMEFDLIDFD